MKKLLFTVFFATQFVAASNAADFAARPERNALTRPQGTESPYQNAVVAQATVAQNNDETKKENEKLDLISSVRREISKSIKGVIVLPGGDVRLAINNDVIGIGESFPKTEKSIAPTVYLEGIKKNFILIKLEGDAATIEVPLDDFFNR